MRKIILHWLLAVALTAIGFTLGHCVEMRYLKAKYPSVYEFEHTKASDLDYTYDANTGLVTPTPKADAHYSPKDHERYSAEKNILTFGIILASAIIATGSLLSASRRKE